MPTRPRSYHRPESLTEALELLSQPNAVPLAGGTKLLAKGTSAAVVDLQFLGWNQIQWAGDRCRIGAMVTLTAFAEALDAKDEAQGPAMVLGPALRLAGPNTYRNAATVGGMIASRLADSELLAALLVLDADLIIHDREVMSISLVDYLVAPETPTGLISEVGFDWNKGVGCSQRVARTPADYPIVSVTCWKPEDRYPRLAATGISARPVRLSEAERCLTSDHLETAIDEAVVAARKTSTHPGDFRGDADYRADMAAVLTRRVVEATLGLAI